MWAPVTTTAPVALRTDLYPHGTAAFTTAQQLAEAAGGAVLISAYTIGADATNAGALSAGQAVSAAQTAFTTAAVIATAAVIVTLFLVKPRVPADPPPVLSTPHHAS